jgi:hypothetical protein
MHRGVDLDAARQDIIIAPALIAKRMPVVIVATISAHIHHVIDEAGAPNAAPTRKANSPLVQMPLGNGLEGPIEFRVFQVERGPRDLHQGVRRIVPGFDQKHLAARVLRQAIR